jgi:hypothetical protein
VIVVAKRAGSYEERTCLRCFEGRVYDIQRGALGGMRAVLGQWAGGGLPLPQAKAPFTLARGVILFGPESHCQGSGLLCRGAGWVAEMGGCIAQCVQPLEKLPLLVHLYTVRKGRDNCTTTSAHLIPDAPRKSHS